MHELGPQPVQVQDQRNERAPVVGGQCQRVLPPPNLNRPLPDDAFPHPELPLATGFAFSGAGACDGVSEEHAVNPMTSAPSAGRERRIARCATTCPAGTRKLNDSTARTSP